MFQNFLHTNENNHNQPSNDAPQFLVQVNRIKLQDYVQCGLVAPDRYLGDEIEHDSQSSNPSFLMLSHGFVEPLNETQLLIELIITEEECKKLHAVNDVFYMDFPLPLSRIKKVYAHDKKTIQWVCTNLHTSEKGFLPERLFGIYLNKKEFLFKKVEKSVLDESIQAQDFTEYIRKFDKRMGMLAFVKNMPLYFCDKQSEIANYSEHYFRLLSYFFEEKLDDKELSGLFVLKENSALKEMLYSDKPIDAQWIQGIIDEMEASEIKEDFSKILLPNSTFKTLQVLLEKQAYLYYYITLIYYFRQKDANRKDSFKSQIEQYMPYNVAETALALLGLYLGYKSLRAKETVEITDKVFSKLFGSEFPIKFTLESQLDYMSIEAIYCFVFSNRQKRNEFSYLVYPDTYKPLELPKDRDFLLWHDVSTKKYFDVTHIKIRKKGYEELIESRLEQYGDEIVLGKEYLLSFIAKYFKSSLCYSKEGKPTEPFCKKHEILSFLKEEASDAKRKELFKVLELDKK